MGRESGQPANIAVENGAIGSAGDAKRIPGNETASIGVLDVAGSMGSGVNVGIDRVIPEVSSRPGKNYCDSSREHGAESGGGLLQHFPGKGISADGCRGDGSKG